MNVDNRNGVAFPPPPPPGHRPMCRRGNTMPGPGPAGRFAISAAFACDVQDNAMHLQLSDHHRAPPTPRSREDELLIPAARSTLKKDRRAEGHDDRVERRELISLPSRLCRGFCLTLLYIGHTMSQLSRTPALLRGLRASTSTPAAHAARRIPGALLGAHYQTRWASSDPKKDAASSRGRQEGSFKGQMLESITQRIAREKTELRQAAQEREAKGGGRNIATTISE